MEIINQYLSAEKHLYQGLQILLRGIQDMTVGKRLWIIILIKLFIFFIVLKLFFFPDFLESRFESQEERGDYVLEQLTN